MHDALVATPAPRTWDIFCRVLDNYGDAAFAWRLARALTHEHAGVVRLVIDDVAALAKLAPQLSVDAETQCVDTITIHRWTNDLRCDDPAEVVIDAFGCGLPERYAIAMASRTPSSLWIVTEYLSAESWVAEHHGLPSPHPQWPIVRYFFFPGFALGTGGLLREAGYATRQAAFSQDRGAPARFWQAAGFAPVPEARVVLSLFSYENDAIAKLLWALTFGVGPTVLAVTAGRAAVAVARVLGVSSAPGTIAKRGQLEARFLPFLAQPQYDELLWLSDWNFVRGEDSMLRTQWAARPFAWQAYPQGDRAHDAKIEALLSLYARDLSSTAAKALRDFWRSWNGMPSAADAGTAWSALAPHRAEFARHARSWPARLADFGEFTAALTRFCADRLK